jgi:hypothetical protein
MSHGKLLLTLLFLMISALTSLEFFAQANNTGGVRVDLFSVENEGAKNKAFKFTIRNSEGLPVLLPRHGPRGQNKIESLNIEVLQTDGKWELLPAHHELPPWVSGPVRIEAGETYNGEFSLDNPYHVSAWDAYPRPAYDIPIRGKIRIEVKYFLGEKDWEDYVSEHKSATEPAAGQRAHAKTQQIAISEPIELPEDGGGH